MGDLELLEAADHVFRAACIEILSNTCDEYSVFDSYDLDPKNVLADPLSLLDDLLSPCEPSTYLYPLIDEKGEITKFLETTKEANEFGTSSVSMSLNRAPLANATSIKGSSSSVPFYPGGFDDALDSVMAFAKVDENIGYDEESYFREDELLTCAPGLPRGIEFLEDHNNMKHNTNENITSSDHEILDFNCAEIFNMLDFVGGGDNLMAISNTKQVENENRSELTDSISQDESAAELESTLEIEISKSLPEVIVPNTKSFPTQFAYAKVLNAWEDIKEYKDLVPHMAKKFPFDLDPFQQAAVVCMEKGESIFVAAHTSAGKTVVAEYAVALCKQRKTRAIYTSPIKALSNQKFRDFKMIFDDVGLVTGDIQLYPEAFCLIMTTEILRSMLYNGSEVIRDLEWVVFDEVHYINNTERGHVWEEVLIMLPAHVKIVMLSATVPNCVEFANWVGLIKNRRIHVVSTPKRPVPLEHYLYTGQDGKTKKDLFKIVDMNGQWVPKGFALASDAKSILRKNEKNSRGRGGFYQGGGKLPTKNDKNIYINLIDHLKSKEQLPMVVFVFSRKRCDENAQLLSSVDLTTEVEKSHIRSFFAQCISRLKGSDKVLPQVLLMWELCMRGFAVHHSGILPILKEVVELLFQKGYVKILFATETFAMGVNMPARTVVFDSIQKHDGNHLRTLNAGEYIQMAGRAGRRGLDTTGTVIVLCKGQNLPEQGELQTVMMGKAARLESQFRVTYSMLLNLLRVEQLKVEDMLQRSYVENVSLRERFNKKDKLLQAQTRLSEMPLFECSVCEPTKIEATSLRDFHEALLDYLRNRRNLWPNISALPVVDKLLNCGRILIVSSARYNLQNQMVILLKESVVGGQKYFQVFVPCNETEWNINDQKKKEEEFINVPAEGKLWLEESNLLEGACKFGPEGVRRSTSGWSMFRMVNELPLSALVAIGKKQLKIDAAEVLNEAKLRELPRFRSNPIAPGVSKLILDLESLSDEWSKSGSKTYNLGIDVKITDIDLYENVEWLGRMRASLEDPTRYPARHCSRFEQHFATLRERIRVECEVSRLQYDLSADSLLLIDDYQRRLKVLTALGYVTKGNMVSFKGRVACEIHHQELLITELILESKLHLRSPAEVAALLSVTTCQYKNGQEVKFEEGSIFELLRKDVEEVSNKIEAVATSLRTRVFDAGDELRYDLMQVVYHWASGMPFSEIMTMTDAQEGLIVRCIQRLGEVCKDVRNAARIVGDPALQEKMEEVGAAIKRDIVFAASLYTSM